MESKSGNVLENTRSCSRDSVKVLMAYDGSGRRVSKTRMRKERDDETALNYFGARYLDPMIGLWTSVDAARQHFSPYTYGSNNPVMRIDPDGNQDAFDLGWDAFVREMKANDVGAVEKFPDALKETGIQAWNYAKAGSAIGAIIDPEPQSKAVLTGLNAMMNIVEGTYNSLTKDDCGAGFTKGVLGAGGTLLTKDADVLASVGMNFAVDVTNHLVDNIASKICAEPSPTRMLPTSGNAPADNTNTSIPDLR